MADAEVEEDGVIEVQVVGMVPSRYTEELGTVDVDGDLVARAGGENGGERSVGMGVERRLCGRGDGAVRWRVSRRMVAREGDIRWRGRR